MSAATDPRRPSTFEPLEPRQLLSAGQLDPTFGDGGKVLTDAGLAYGSNVAVQADGKILATATSDTFRDFNLIRYNPDGTLDATFGDGGIVSNRFAGTHSDFIETMALLPDGRIVVAGRSYAADGGYNTLVARYNADGSLDTAFGNGGVVTLPGDTYDPTGPLRAAFSPGRALLAAQADGRILVTQVLGDDGSATGADLVVIRLTDTGALDTTFGAGGKATIELGAIDTPQDLALRADGKIVVAVDAHTLVTSGNSTSWPTTQTHLVRLNADGSLDSSFGTGGVVTENHTFQQITATRVAVGLDGKILLMGEDFDAGGDVRTFLIRYAADGSRDASFGTGGKRVIGGAGATYAGLLVQPDGKLLLTGGGMDGGTHPALFSQRLNADGTPDAAYGDNGTTRVEVGTSFDFAHASALQQDGGVVVVGSANKIDHSETDYDPGDVALIRLTGDAGAAGSRHFSLRRGIDQQGEYTGKAPGRRPNRSPKRRAMDLARQQAAAVVGTLATVRPPSVFNATRAIEGDDLGVLA